MVIVGAWWLMGRSANAPVVTPSPTIAVSASPTPSPTTAQPVITITSPTVNASVDSPILVTGSARVFENQFTVQLRDSAGKVIYHAMVMTDAKDIGLLSNYKVYLPIPANATPNLKVEAFALSPKGDGTYSAYASAKVTLKTTDTSSVYVAFITGNDCTTTTLFARQVIKSPQYVLLSLMELLKGPGVPEVGLGATTQIPVGAQINSFHMTGDTAYVDFNSTLSAGVASSCKAQSIRAEITNTLKQFLGLNTVVISIDGKVNGILQ